MTQQTCNVHPSTEMFQCESHRGSNWPSRHQHCCLMDDLASVQFQLGAALGSGWPPYEHIWGWGQSRTVVCEYRCRTHVDPSGPLSRRTVRMIQWEGQAWHGHLSPGQAVSVKWPLSTWRIGRRHLLNGLALADELQNSWNWLAPVLCHGRGCVCLYGDGVCCWPNWENHFTVEYGLFKIESLD